MVRKIIGIPQSQKRCPKCGTHFIDDSFAHTIMNGLPNEFDRSLYIAYKCPFCEEEASQNSYVVHIPTNNLYYWQLDILSGRRERWHNSGLWAKVPL